MNKKEHAGGGDNTNHSNNRRLCTEFEKTFATTRRIVLSVALNTKKERLSCINRVRLVDIIL
jgi:hypothetical protein